VINRPLFYTACAVLGLMIGVGGAEAYPAEQAKANTVLVTSPSEADTSEAESGEPRRKAASDTPDVPTARGLVARSNASEPVTQPTGTPATTKAQEAAVSEQDPEPEPQDPPQVKEPRIWPTQPEPVRPTEPQPPAAGAQPVPKTQEELGGTDNETPEPEPTEEPVTTEQ
jgi:hypothetical protein